jgi:hypothetical protein
MSASGFSSGGVGAAAAAAAVFRAPASFSRGSIVDAAAYVFRRLLFFSGRISVDSAVRRLSLLPPLRAPPPLPAAATLERLGRLVRAARAHGTFLLYSRAAPPSAPPS